MEENENIICRHLKNSYAQALQLKPGIKINKSFTLFMVCNCGERNEVMTNAYMPMSISIDVFSDDPCYEIECAKCHSRVGFYVRPNINFEESAVPGAMAAQPTTGKGMP